MSTRDNHNHVGYVPVVLAGMFGALASGLLKFVGLQQLPLRVLLVGLATGAALFAWRKWVARTAV